MVFFLAALVLVASDKIYLGHYSQSPNYLAILAVVGAVFGLVNRTGPALIAAPAPDEFPIAAGAQRWSVFAVFLAFLAFYAVTGNLEPSPYNAHVRQAVAFLHGHTDIDYDQGIEMVVFAGRHFQLHPPLPALLMMPFAAIWGMDTNQTAFSLVTGAIDAALAWCLLGRLKLSLSGQVWLTLFFGIGTVMWFETINAGSWDVSQTVAVGFVFWALAEVFGPSRPGVIGLLAGLSALARNDLALDFPIFAGLCYVQSRNWRQLLWMAPGFALAGIVYIGLNEARFNSVFDLGQFLYTPGTPTFAVMFLPQNLYTLLFMAPVLDNTFPFIHPNQTGQALTFTSPAFVLALRAKLTDITPALLLVGALLAMMPSLFFNNTGTAQFGTRHYIHSFPFLLVLMAKGLPGGVDQLTKILIVTSMVLIGAGVLQIRVWGFG